MSLRRSVCATVLAGSLGACTPQCAPLPVADAGADVVAEDATIADVPPDLSVLDVPLGPDVLCAEAAAYNAADAATPIGCSGFPPPISTPDPDSSCGANCTLISTLVPDSNGKWEIGDRVGGGVEYAGLFTVYSNDTVARVQDTYWYGTGMLNLCSGGGDGVTALATYPDATLVTCTSGTGWEVHEMRRATGAQCTIVAGPALTAPGAAAPYQVVRVRGGLAWLRSLVQDGSEVFFWPYGGAAPIQLTHCDCVHSFAAGDDVIAFTRDSLTGGTALWIARPPFTCATRVWDPGLAMGALSMDPDNAHHLALAAGQGDTLCIHGNIYTADLDAPDGIGIRQITNDAATQAEPHVRDDNLVYIDFSMDPLNPGGCPNDPHALTAFTRTSWSNPGPGTTLFSGSNIGLAWLATDRAYVVTQQGLGYVLY